MKPRNKDLTPEEVQKLNDLSIKDLIAARDYFGSLVEMEKNTRIPRFTVKNWINGSRYPSEWSIHLLNEYVVLQKLLGKLTAEFGQEAVDELIESL
jgi:hypothetical protein